MEISLVIDFVPSENGFKGEKDVLTETHTHAITMRRSSFFFFVLAHRSIVNTGFELSKLGYN